MAPKAFTTHDFLVSFGPDETILASCPNEIFFHNIYTSNKLHEALSHASQVGAVAYPLISTASVSTNFIEKQAQSSAELVSKDKVTDPYVAYARKGKMLVTHHEMYQPTNDGAIPKLSAWLHERSSYSSLQIVSNAQGGWWALAGNGETSFDSLAPALRQLLKSSSSLGKVTHVALGTDDAYVAIFEDGNFQWDLADSYPDLDSYLGQRVQGQLIYVSLDPFQGGQFFAAFSDATVLYKLPSSASELETALINADSLNVILFSSTVQHSTLKLPQNKSYWVGFLQEVGAKADDKLADAAADQIAVFTEQVVQEYINN